MRKPEERSNGELQRLSGATKAKCKIGYGIFFCYFFAEKKIFLLFKLLKKHGVASSLSTQRRHL